MTRFTLAMIFALSAAGFAYHSTAHIKADLVKYLANNYSGGPVVACDANFAFLEHSPYRRQDSIPTYQQPEATLNQYSSEFSR